MKHVHNGDVSDASAHNRGAHTTREKQKQLHTHTHTHIQRADTDWCCVSWAARSCSAPTKALSSRRCPQKEAGFPVVGMAVFLPTPSRTRCGRDPQSSMYVDNGECPCLCVYIYVYVFVCFSFSFFVFVFVCVCLCVCVLVCETSVCVCFQLSCCVLCASVACHIVQVCVMFVLFVSMFVYVCMYACMCIVEPPCHVVCCGDVIHTCVMCGPWPRS